MYASSGCPSLPPEQLLGALLLQAVYGLRSQQLLLEQLNYNMLQRWFVELGTDDPVWHQSSFGKNREPLGTLLQAWASHHGSPTCGWPTRRGTGRWGVASPQPGQGFGTADTGSGEREKKSRTRRDLHGKRFNHRTYGSSSDTDGRLACHSRAQSARDQVLMEIRHQLA